MGVDAYFVVRLALKAVAVVVWLVWPAASEGEGDEEER